MMKHTRPKVCSQEKTGCHTLNPKKGAVKKCINNTDITPPPVISTVGAEWRNLTPKCGKPMVAGDLSALRFIRAQSPCHPYRRVPPLEMMMPAGSIQSFPGDKLPQTLPRTPVISTVGAEWRNLTLKRGKPMVAGDLSTLRFIRAQNLYHPYRRVPPLEMTMPAGS